MLAGESAPLPICYSKFCQMLTSEGLCKIAIHRDTYGDKNVSENDIIFAIQSNGLQKMISFSLTGKIRAPPRRAANLRRSFVEEGAGCVCQRKRSLAATFNSLY